MTRFHLFLQTTDKTQLAKTIEVSRQLVDAWARGSMPSPNMIRKLVEGAGLDYSDFFEEADDILN